LLNRKIITKFLLLKQLAFKQQMKSDEIITRYLRQVDNKRGKIFSVKMLNYQQWGEFNLDIYL